MSDELIPCTSHRWASRCEGDIPRSRREDCYSRPPLLNQFLGFVRQKHVAFYPTLDGLVQEFMREKGAEHETGR